MTDKIGLKEESAMKARREFMKRAGAAATVAPAVVLLLSATSRQASALYAEPA